MIAKPSHPSPPAWPRIAPRCARLAAAAAVALGLLATHVPTPAAAAAATVPHVTQRQINRLDCEAAALQIALSSRGISMSQQSIMAAIPNDTRPAVMSGGVAVQWGDPYTAFVGDYNGSEEQFTGYGVYWPPVAAAARRAGSPVIAGEGWSVEAVLREVERGHAVVVWTVNTGGAPAPRYWTAFDGRSVRYAFGEHAEVLVGVSRPAGTVVLANPGTGRDDTMSIGQFAATFAVFNDMAVVIGGGGGAGMAVTSSGHGYWIAGPDGSVTPFGDASNLGQAAALPLAAPVVSMAVHTGAGGYWLAAADGGIFPFGNALGYGSTGNLRLNRPIVGLAATRTGRGYWLVAADGGIFPFGDATGWGSTGNIRLNQPIVGMAVTPDGGGYWLVAADGGIFPFGDAPGWGSTGNIHLNQPIVGMATSPRGGYWLVAADGGIFPFGPGAPGYGSTGGIRLAQPMTGMAAMPDGSGYWLVARDGGIFPFGAAAGYGSTA